MVKEMALNENVGAPRRPVRSNWSGCQRKMGSFEHKEKKERKMGNQWAKCSMFNKLEESVLKQKKLEVRMRKDQRS